ncbi:MAG: aldo/keto reductase [Stackebrandtia sp.]
MVSSQFFERARPSRRSVMKAAGAGAMVAATGAAVASSANADTPSPRLADGDLITRTIPRTGEEVPAIGLGTFMTWDILPEHPRDDLRETLETHWAGGGRVVDTSVLYGMPEENIGEFASELGVVDEMFVTAKTWTTGEYLSDPSHVQAQFEQTRERLSREQIDVLQVHNCVNPEMNLAIMRQFQEEGLVRHLAITHHDSAYHQVIEGWMNSGDVDFVQVRYSIFDRTVEERILPAAADNGVAVLVCMPLEKARLHDLVSDRDVPEWAAEELGCENWSQFFLKWILGNPDVTVVLPGTGTPAHVAENVGAMRGPIPDDKQRKRMRKYMEEEVPGFADINSAPWYPGKTYDKGLVQLPS